MDVLANGRKVNDGYIFGSKPPENDSFWEKYAQVSHCEVIMYDHSCMHCVLLGVSKKMSKLWFVQQARVVKGHSLFLPLT